MKSLWQSLCDQTREMAETALQSVQTRADWEGIRPVRYQEFMRGLGLDPLPERCALNVTETGQFSGKGYTARKLGFQVLPDCWSSANLYLPDPLPAGRLPAVLYVCGHATIGTYHYQYHPILWARRGYACLILDSIEQNDNPGEHHAYVMGQTDARVALGFTPAGAEVWNAMRALDLLSAEPAVDPERLAITGVSGGGACSCFTAVADARVKAVSTLCGLSTPFDAIANQHLNGHCECMYPLNLFRRDLSEFTALIAPRAAQFCFADDDPLFNPEETAALVDRTRRVFALLGAEDRCRLVTCPGAHGDHPPFDDATSQWFDQHVAGDARPRVARGAREQPEAQLSIFNGRPPSPNRLHLLPELMSTRGTLPLPRTVADWPERRHKTLEALSFLDAKPLYEGFLKPAGEWVNPGTTVRRYQGRVDGVEIHLETQTPPNAKRLLLSVASEGENSRHAQCAAACGVPSGAYALGGLVTRIAGAAGALPAPERLPPGSWPPSTRKILEMGLRVTAGLTPVMLMIQDLGVALDFLFDRPEYAGRDLWLYGRGDAGIAALYRAVLDDRVAGVVVEQGVSSHADGAPITGILRLFDIPHAVGLMAPRWVTLVNAGHSNWTWPARVYERLGCPGRFRQTGDLRSALSF